MRKAYLMGYIALTLTGCSEVANVTMSDAEKKAYVQEQFNAQVAMEKPGSADPMQIWTECSLELRSGEQCAQAEAAVKALATPVGTN